MIRALRKDCLGEVFNYTFLVDHLQNYADPRGKIHRMSQSGEIVRVKKGLYVFGEEYRDAPINRGILANLIYGPSYVSGLYALGQHGLIPERVETVTNMTTQRNRRYGTPFGSFEYLHLSAQRYTVGVDWQQVGVHERYLLASPEKALADVVAKERSFVKVSDVKQFLFDSLRLDEELLVQLDFVRMAKIAAAYRSSVVSLLNEVLMRMM